MGGSFKIMTVRGIDIKVHVTFFLILVYAAVVFGQAGRGLSGAIFGIVATLLLFVCVVLHELGHSVVAQHYNIPVRDITLWPIGGVARLERMPDKPAQEFWVAIAGPAVNFVIVGVIFVVARVLSSVQVGLDLSDLEQGMLRLQIPTLLAYLFTTNLFLAIFNLIPAFPMDGGRILRALLASRLNYARATAIAVGIGQNLALLAGLYGFLSGQLNLVLIAIFVFLGAGSEGQLAQVKGVLGDLKVRQAFSRRTDALDPNDRLTRAVDLTLSSFQSDFPVCENGQLVGLLTKTDLISALQQRGSNAFVVSVMRKEFPTIGLDESLFKAQQMMAENNIEAVPVLENGEFRGLLTLRDVDEVFRLLSASPQLLQSRRATPTARAGEPVI
ncbi:MAG TPA: site-2 protease family protein [Anaerolineae bacterium]|nr:site-2 protease family protein [Anaerolineae bacterium]